MGPFAERLARRKHHLFPRAKELVRLANLSLKQESEDDDVFQDEDFDSLHDALQECLHEFSAEEFDELMALAMDQARLSEDTQAVAMELAEGVRDVCEELPLDYNGTTDYLFALPLQVKLRPNQTELPLLPEEQTDEVAELLRSFDQIDEEAAVLIAPRFLLARESEDLRAKDVFDLLTALSDEEVDNALAVLNSRAAVAEESFSGETEPFIVTPEGYVNVTLVGVVTSDEANPFVMAKLFSMEHTDLPPPSDARFGTLHHQMHVDADAHLQALALELAVVLELPDVRVTAPLSYWSVNSADAYCAERAELTRRQLGSLCSNPAAPALSELAVGRPTPHAGSITCEVRRKTGNQVVGELTWPEAKSEPWQMSLTRLLAFLSEHGLAAELGTDEAKPAGTLH